MPAILDEIKEAEEEGARFEFLVRPVNIRSIKNGRIAVTFQRMKLGKPDQSNRPRPIPVKGDFLTLKADSLIAAVSENVDLSWVPESLVKNGLVDVDSSLITNQNKVFAGGDAIDQPRTVVTAIASGKRAAISIDLYLKGLSSHEFSQRIRVGNKGSLSMEAYLSGMHEGKWPEVKDVILYDRLNTLFFEPSKRAKIRRVSRNKALRGFSEVNRGFSSDQAHFSALRCFTCGTCNYCYNCYFFCPEGVIFLDPLNQTKIVDLDHCKGCGTCAKTCPRFVVRMKEVG